MANGMENGDAEGSQALVALEASFSNGRFIEAELENRL